MVQEVAILVDFALQQELLVELAALAAAPEHYTYVISLFALQLINLLK